MDDVQKVIAMIEDNPWHRELIDFLENVQDKKALDCGCGTGSMSVYLRMKGAYVEGFDISSEMVKGDNKKLTVRY